MKTKRNPRGAGRKPMYGITLTKIQVYVNMYQLNAIMKHTGMGKNELIRSMLASYKI